MINRRNSPGGGRGERVAIFIDGSNLYHSLQENCGRFDVDFAALGQRLTDGRELLRIYYYNVLRDSDRDPQAYQDQQKFLTALHNTPYIETRLGSSKMRGQITVEKGIDIMVATGPAQVRVGRSVRRRHTRERGRRLRVCGRDGQEHGQARRGCSVHAEPVTGASRGCGRPPLLHARLLFGHMEQGSERSACRAGPPRAPRSTGRSIARQRTGTPPRGTTFPRPVSG